MTRTLGILLAGGKSSRMGQDKAKLNWFGRSLLDHQIDTLENVVGHQHVYVSGTREGYNSIQDRLSSRGPLEGIYSTLSELLVQNNDFSVLVVPIDMPYLSSEILKRLIHGSDSADACFFSQACLPVFLRSPRKIIAAIDLFRSKACSSDFSLRSLYSLISTCELTCLEPETLKNFNTPEEWSATLSKANLTQ